jgi:predicted transcriptional regulator
MKIGELVNGLYYMITNEQREFFKNLRESGPVSRHELDERSQRLAEEMSGLGIIEREYDEKTETVIYKPFSK